MPEFAQKIGEPEERVDIRRGQRDPAQRRTPERDQSTGRCTTCSSASAAARSAGTGWADPEDVKRCRPPMANPAAEQQADKVDPRDERGDDLRVRVK